MTVEVVIVYAILDTGKMLSNVRKHGIALLSEQWMCVCVCFTL